MSLTLLDFILIGIMLISGLLALMRGFTREVLSHFGFQALRLFSPATVADVELQRELNQAETALRARWLHRDVQVLVDAAVAGEIADANRFEVCNHKWGVLAGVREALDMGNAFAMTHEYEIAVAEKICALAGVDLVRFATSGTEATMHAIRIARAYTARNKVLKFEGHYHGCYDEALVSLTPPPDAAGPDAAPQAVAASLGTSEYTLQSVQVLPFNDAEDTVRLIKAHKNDLAAVILEPVQRGFIPADIEFLRAVREVTEELGIVLIFDEVMSGFRMDKLGGAQTMFGVTPDIMCLGKIIGGGFPCGAFLGKKEIMDVVNPVTRPKDSRVFHGGTFNGHPTVLAAGRATIGVLEEPETYPYLMRITDKLQDGLNDLFSRSGFDARAVGPGTTFNILFDGKKKTYLGQADAGIQVPIVDKRSAQIVSITPGQGVQLMDLETYETIDIATPTDEEITGKIAAGKEVEYWIIMGRYKINRVKS